MRYPVTGDWLWHPAGALRELKCKSRYAPALWVWIEETGPVCHPPGMNQIHGHEVLEMMMASGKTYTFETLVQDIYAKFGREARFHTCSAENMTAVDLIEFFEAHGKLLPRTGGFSTSKDVMCQS